MMFPASLCGVWCLINCPNPQFLGSTMVVDYSNFKFTHSVKKYGYGTVNVRKNVYGSVFLSDASKGKVAWSKKMNYSVESSVLPKLVFPWSTKCPCFNITYSLDATGNELTVLKSNDKYVFLKQYVSLDSGDSFFKIFMTQLLFDFILRHFHG